MLRPRRLGPRTVHVVAAASPRPGLVTPQVATGPGFVADEAASRGCEVVALDFSSEMLALAEPLTRKHAKLTLKQGDAQALPFADESFDAVTVAFGRLPEW